LPRSDSYLVDARIVTAEKDHDSLAEISAILNLPLEVCMHETVSHWLEGARAGTFTGDDMRTLPFVTPNGETVRLITDFETPIKG